MKTANLGPGLAPDIAVDGARVYVAYGQETPSELRLATLDLNGNVLSNVALAGGFFDSFPRFGFPWVFYKRSAPTYGPRAMRIDATPQTLDFPGVAAGNYGLATNQPLGLFAYQNGATYPIWVGDLSGAAVPNGEAGAPDGLDTLVDQAHVTLRKDTRLSVPGLTWPVRSHDATAGEWAASASVYGLGAQLDGDVLRVVVQGNCPTPRCATDSATYAFVTGGPDGVRVFIGSRADVQACPTAASLTPVPDDPIGPRSDPRAADGRLYDIAAFLTTESTLQPRSGPTHPQYQTQPNADGVFFLIKFGDVVPEGRAYEMYGLESGGYRHLEDASGSTPMHFTDTRWWPRKMQIGEAHAFKTGEHQEVWDERDPCRETHRDPVNRKMWLHAVWDSYHWGPDLGDRPTCMLVYDDTDQAELPGRYVEVGYYAVGAGWCRWEAYHAEQVYPNGPQHGAVFPPEAMSSRSDFYLVGGPAPTVQLTGCVQPVIPTTPAWDTVPVPPQPTSEFPLFEGVHMEDQKVALVGPNGLYASVDPTTKALTFDRTTAGAWETWTLSAVDGDGRKRYTFTPDQATDHVLGVDTTQYGSNDVRKLFYLKPKSGGVGNYEQFDVRSDQLSALTFALIEYIDQGVVTKPFGSPVVTVVKL